MDNEENQSHGEKIRYYEFDIKQFNQVGVSKDLKDLTFLGIKDITALIKNLQKFKDKVYYDAIENNFSHELMTPLNPITNSSSLLKKGIL